MTDRLIVRRGYYYHKDELYVYHSDLSGIVFDFTVFRLVERENLQYDRFSNAFIP